MIININIGLTNNISHLPPRPQPFRAKILKTLVVSASAKIFFVKKKLLEKCEFVGPLNVVGPRASARSAPLNPPLTENTVRFFERKVTWVTKKLKVVMYGKATGTLEVMMQRYHFAWHLT